MSVFELFRYDCYRHFYGPATKKDLCKTNHKGNLYGYISRPVFKNYILYRYFGLNQRTTGAAGLASGFKHITEIWSYFMGEGAFDIFRREKKLYFFSKSKLHYLQC